MEIKFPTMTSSSSVILQVFFFKSIYFLLQLYFCFNFFRFYLKHRRIHFPIAFSPFSPCIHACMRVKICVCMYVCVYVCIICSCVSAEKRNRISCSFFHSFFYLFSFYFMLSAFWQGKTKRKLHLNYVEE